MLFTNALNPSLLQTSRRRASKSSLPIQTMATPQQWHGMCILRIWTSVKIGCLKNHPYQKEFKHAHEEYLGEPFARWKYDRADWMQFR